MLVLAPKGIRFEAQHENGDKAEIFFMGDQVHTHVDDVNGGQSSCQAKSEALASKIQAGLRQYHHGILGGFGSRTAGSGFGNGNLLKEKEAPRREEKTTGLDAIETEANQLNR